jgi:hypothetical protein
MCRYLTPVSALGGNVFTGKLDASMAGDAAHAYVPNLSAQGAGYTFGDGSGVAQRLLGNFAAGHDEQKAVVAEALQASVRIYFCLELAAPSFAYAFDLTLLPSSVSARLERRR